MEDNAFRQLLTRRLLIEGLGLDDEWLDPDAISVARGLPDADVKRITPEAAEVLEAHLDYLVSRGCERGVLYQCLIEFPPDSRLRKRGAQTLPPLEDDPKQRVRITAPRRLPTKEDMDTLVGRAIAFKKSLAECRPGILLMEEVMGAQFPLPDFFQTDLPDAGISALRHVGEFVTMIEKIAKQWQTPYETTLLKSKETLHLMVYVEMCVEHPPEAPGSPLPAVEPNERTNAPVGPLTGQDFNIIADINLLYFGNSALPAELNAKLKTFKVKEKELYLTMKSKLSALDQSSRPTRP